VFEALRAKDILVNLHYIPIHTQPHYQQMGFKQGDFPQAEQYYREAISLPMHVNLTNEDQDTVINALKCILQTPR
jgi:dTDP-4-amino-4,6-dideoxygalactose transaminase